MSKKPTKPVLRKYTVTLVRTIEHRAVVEDVEASTQQEAVEKAIEIADGPSMPSLWREGDVLGEDSKAKLQ
jgi:hypothetical protein